MAEDQERPNQPPKGGWTHRIRSFFNKGGGERPQLSSQPQTEAPLDIPPLTPIKESTFEEIHDPDFGAKDYIIEAIRIGYPVTERKVGEYIVVQVNSPWSWGTLRSPFGEESVESESEVSAVLLEGRVVGAKLRTWNKISDKWRSRNEAREIGIPGEMVTHYRQDVGIPHFEIFLGRLEELTSRDQIDKPEDAFLRLVRFGNHLSRADVEVNYGWGLWSKDPQDGWVSQLTTRFHHPNNPNRYLDSRFDISRSRDPYYDTLDKIISIVRSHEPIDSDLELPLERGSRQHHLKLNPQGMLVLSREFGDGISVGVEFPPDISKTVPVDSLGQIFESDTDWLNLPRLIPVRFIQILPPPKK